jgi:anthranilate phosphoribosyltransferase
MRSAFAAVLDGGASDLEIGALMTASMLLETQRAADWFAEIILGLNDAIRARMTPLIMEARSTPVVVLPNYGDEDAFPAIPLVALLLRRIGVRVLVHGAVETHGGLLNCSIFREFGILPAASRRQAERQLAENSLALLPVTLFSPGLAAMLSVRNRLGIRTPAHALANMLMPVLETSAGCLHVLRIAPWLKSSLADQSVATGTPALLVSAAESCFDGAGRRAYLAFRDGKGASWQVLLDSDCTLSPTAGPLRPDSNFSPGQRDPRTWAAWTHLHLDGKAGLPLLVSNLVASCLYGSGFAKDLHEARAIVAVDAGQIAAPSPATSAWEPWPIP